MDAEVVRDVAHHVQAAIGRNRRTETSLIVLVFVVAVSGLSLLWAALFRQQWMMAMPGSLCELAVGWPIRELFKLRRENIRLEILPQLMRLADDAGERKLFLKAIERLVISQI
jgi:hypothetical protein